MSQLVAGIDSSSQSTKVVLVRAEDGVVVDQASSPHPVGTEVDPQAWWEALQLAGSGLLDRAAAIGVGGQQHGMVALDADGAVVRPALLWNDLRSAPQIADVIAHFGGEQQTADAIGSVPPASFTVTKLRWMAENEPENAERTSAVMLPHDWLTWMLAGGPGSGAEMVTDHGDASGTGYYSPARRDWLPEVAAWALGRGPGGPAPQLPRIAGPGEVVGTTTGGAQLSAGTGDNMAAALGLCLRDGDVVVSIGTSGTAFCVTDSPRADPTGSVSGFADASGRYLPLVCTVNASRILSVTARLLGVDHDEFAALALAAEPGAGGLTFLPYMDGERTPNRPTATGVLSGLTSGVQREDLARAAVEALLGSLGDAIDALGVVPGRVLVIGGAARNPAVQQLAPAVWGLPVEFPVPGEYVALGAARQAAWALSGADEPPAWAPPETTAFTADPTPVVRRRYDVLRDRTADWTESRA
ncbi:xylulokinase [Nakamurella flavida]|uniref:Xylulose kinase n=1 Tax=Nakamurella flavida TaxID=363630 RepID=A0A938YIQ4_9ACTN|nr:xylulokinase [Nakamurella flavida]MBM9476692.1 xylulokinase [Nakamurella flavida]MDP9778870.1 xylulokinase [Nakamurella flavida]